MDAQLVPDVGDGMRRSSSVVSPLAHRILQALPSPAPNLPRWAKEFKPIKANPKDKRSRPHGFIARSRASSVSMNLPLTAVDTTAGKGDCLAATRKQWDTIIKQAKADDKVPDDLKAAKFYHFGNVIRDPKPEKPSRAYTFVRHAWESDTKEQTKGLPLPLKDYAADRRRKMRRRPCSRPLDLAPGNSEPSFLIPDSTSTKSMGTSDKIQELTDNSRVHVSDRSNVRRNLIRHEFGQDYSFMDRAAEETYNDSELIKGVGRVPVNQRIPEPEEPIEDKPYKLSPSAYASKDLLFPLQHMITSDTNISNIKIFPSAAYKPDLDSPEALLLKWSGKMEQRITVFKGCEIKSVNFKDIIAIKFNAEIRSLLFQFSSPEEISKPEELLLVICPISDMVWMTLQTCCYSVVNGRELKQRCDMEGKEFFDGKTKSLMNLRIKQGFTRPIPQVANRVNTAKKKPTRTKPLFQTWLKRTPSLAAPKRPTPKNDAVPGVQAEANIEGHIPTSERIYLDLTTKTAGDSFNDVQAEIKNEEHHHSLSQSPLNIDAEVDRDDLQRASNNKEQDNTLSENPLGFDTEFDGDDSQEVDNNKERDHTSDQSSLDLITEVDGDPHGASKNKEHGHSLDQNPLDADNEIGEEDLDQVANDTNTDPKINTARLSPLGLYYRSSLKSSIPVPVELHDLVVRLRCDKDKDRGKRDRLDIFDGPWRIVEFDKPGKMYSMDFTGSQGIEDGNDSPSRSQLDKARCRKMLKTKVRLNFPEGSRAPKWIEISQLLPVIEPKAVYAGDLHASNLTVSELNVFKILQKDIVSRKGQIVNSDVSVVNGEVSTMNQIESSDDADKEMDDAEEEEEVVHVVEIKNGIFVAVIGVAPQGINDSDIYEVDKLRGKRLRLYKKNSAIVRKYKLKTDKDDPWVKRLMKERPNLIANRVVVVEYRVHWAGWADEDDDWSLGTGNIPKGFIDEYHVLTDPFRNIPIDFPLSNPENMIFKGDLPAVGKKARRGRRQANGGNRKWPKPFGTESEATEKDKDEEMLDEDEDISIAKVVQASLDDEMAKRTADELKALQKEMGVTPKDPQAFPVDDSDNGTSLALDQSDEEWDHDVVMTEADGDTERW